MIVPNILSIAGTDPSGGAGIQADLKSIAAHGGYGMSVVTALVAQNTLGVRGVHIPPREFFRDQLVAVSDDVRIDAIKIGMLATTDLVAELNDWLDGQPGLADVPVVLDPVMVSTSGHRLLDSSAERLVRELCRRCTIVTPNIPELAILADTVPARNWDEAREQALTLSRSAGVVVLVKGGHLDDALSPDAIVDATVSEPRIVEFVSERISTRNTHGTGCSLSSALATRLGRGADVTSAFAAAQAWLREAIRHTGELRGGAGTALVGDPQTVAARLQEYVDLGVDSFVLSGYPHLEDAYRFAELVFPLLPGKRKVTVDEVLTGGAFDVRATQGEDKGGQA